MDGCEKVNNDIYMLLQTPWNGYIVSVDIYTHIYIYIYIYAVYIETRNVRQTIRFYSLNNLFGRMIDIRDKKRKYFPQ